MSKLLKMRLAIAVLILYNTHCFGQIKSIKEVFLFANESVKSSNRTRQFIYSSSSEYSSFESLVFGPSHKLEGRIPESIWQLSHDSVSGVTQVELIDSVNHLRNFCLEVNRKGDLSVLYGYSIDPRKAVIGHKVSESGEEIITTTYVPSHIRGFFVIDHKGKRVFFLETYLYPGDIYSGNTSLISGMMLLDENLFPVKRIDICNREIKDISEYSYSANKVTEKRYLLSQSESKKIGSVDDLTLSDVYGILKRKIRRIDDTAVITEDKDKIAAPLWLYVNYSKKYYDKSECTELDD